MHLSIVIPAFNEAPKIERDLKATVEYLGAGDARPCEIIVVDDGSKDATRTVIGNFIAQLPKFNPHVRLITYRKNRGKGFAVRRGFAESRGDIVAFMDAGLRVPLHFFELGVEKIEQGFDFAIASRRLPGTKILRPPPLHLQLRSQILWDVTHKIMGVDVTDTQCGFKLFKRPAAQQIFPRVATNGFMFDIEALLIASELGLRGTEFPVQWTGDDRSARAHSTSATLRNVMELSLIRTRTLARRLRRPDARGAVPEVIKPDSKPVKL